MCSGSEAVDSAVKIARKWAYVKKGIPTDEAWILTTDRCYHGVTLATMPLSNVIAQDYGQHVPKVGPFAPTSGELIEYGAIDVLSKTFEEDGHRIAAFMVEPIQGAAGYFVAVSYEISKY
jgi:ornithine--oxo-acid transaminase